MTRRCMYCLLPLDKAHVGEAHAACLDKQQTIIREPSGKKMLGNTLDQTDRERVVAEVQQNPTLVYKELAAKFGVSRQWISWVATSNGLRRKPSRRGPIDRAEILAVVEQNPTLHYKHIAERFGVSRQLVSTVACAAGIHRKPGPRPELDRMRIADELTKGTPVKQITKMMGCSYQIVYRIREALAL